MTWSSQYHCLWLETTADKEWSRKWTIGYYGVAVHQIISFCSSSSHGIVQSESRQQVSNIEHYWSISQWYRQPIWQYHTYEVKINQTSSCPWRQLFGGDVSNHSQEYFHTREPDHEWLIWLVKYKFNETKIINIHISTSFFQRKRKKRKCSHCSIYRFCQYVKMSSLTSGVRTGQWELAR